MLKRLNFNDGYSSAIVPELVVPSGRSIYTGTDVPDDLLYNNGDVYFRDNGDIYVKTDGAWVHESTFYVRIVNDETPQLGGPLDLNDKVLSGDLKRTASSDVSNFILQKYIHSLSLLASQTDTEIEELSFAHAEYSACEITYRLRVDTANFIKIGTLLVVSNGTDVSIVSYGGEIGANEVFFDAVIDGPSVKVLYTSGSNTGNLRCDLKLFKA